MKDEKLQRTFVRKEAYHLLRDQIVEGKLQPNQKLKDKELAEQLGVSRTPIREALLQLEQEGLVQTKANSSTIVTPLDLANSYHLYAIVWTLESLALKQAFEHFTPKHLDLMININEKLRKAIDSKKALLCIKFDDEFHSIFVELSDNGELCQILAMLKQKLKRIELHYFSHIQNAYSSYEEHLQMINALRQKNLSQAQKAIESNWQASFLRIQRQAKGGTFPCNH